MDEAPLGFDHTASIESQSGLDDSHFSRRADDEQFALFCSRLLFRVNCIRSQFSEWRVGCVHVGFIIRQWRSSKIPDGSECRFADAGIGAQIDLPVLDRFPDAFDKDVVAPGTFAVDADGDGVGDQHAAELGA